jgi:phosphotransferase system  glucose/maltose/N-acetylglucosamine-specific IIC component
MKPIVLSSLLAGFIAGFVWMAITVLIGGWSKGAVVGGGFGFLVGTAVVAGIITALIRRSRGGAPA